MSGGFNVRFGAKPNFVVSLIVHFLSLTDYSVGCGPFDDDFLERAAEIDLLSPSELLRYAGEIGDAVAPHAFGKGFQQGENEGGIAAAKAKTPATSIESRYLEYIAVPSVSSLYANRDDRVLRTYGIVRVPVGGQHQPNSLSISLTTQTVSFDWRQVSGAFQAGDIRYCP